MTVVNVRGRRPQRGMTLLEVLIAFAVLSGLVLSVMGLLAQNARYIGSAEDRLLASILSDNLLANDLALREFPNAGVTSDEAEIAGRPFSYDRTVVEVGDQALFIQYAVRRLNEPQVLARAGALRTR